MACAFSSAAACGATVGVSSRSAASRRALSRPTHRIPVRRAARPAAGLFDGGKGDRPVDAVSADGLPRTAKIGILGGGQLGRMLAIAGAPMGVRVHSLDPNPASPASIVAIPTEGSFQDAADVVAFAKDCDVVTVEIEHIDVAALRELEKAGVDVQPCSDTLAIIQDKFAQKEHFKKAGVPLGEFQSVESEEQLAAAAKTFGFPLMLKSRRMAYDGKGNAVAKTEADVKEAVAKLGGFGKGLYCEKWVPFERELAVMVVRARDGETRAYPVTETEHVDNICDVTVTPADVSTFVAAAATEAAQNAVASLEGAGVFGVELFLLENGSILLNEIAPRPHNSGHYTIEATACCQYQSHLRAVLGWPLGDVSLTCGGAVMKNILGDGEGDAAMRRMHDLMGAALKVPGANAHWYDKPEARAGRKMGHLTVVASHARLAMARLETVMAVAGGDPDASVDPPPSVGIIMGSDSDLPTMAAAAETLESFGIGVEVTVVSAHRTPERMFEYAKSAAGRGLRCIIAGAGGAAHLPGMVAAMTPLPVVGVPVKTSALSGVDSLHSIVQMPRGVPVATVAIGNATNAGLLAARILSTSNDALADALEAYAASQRDEVLGKAEVLEGSGWKAYLERKEAPKSTTVM